MLGCLEKRVALFSYFDEYGWICDSFGVWRDSHNTISLTKKDIRKILRLIPRRAHNGTVRQIIMDYVA